MTAKVQKWGNSAAIRLPQSILVNCGFAINDNVDLKETRNGLLIKKTHKTLDDLFRDYKGDYKTEEFDWGKDVGAEIIC